MRVHFIADVFTVQLPMLTFLPTTLLVAAFSGIGLMKTFVIIRFVVCTDGMRGFDTPKAVG